jgi:hypothetical protein
MNWRQFGVLRSFQMDSNWNSGGSPHLSKLEQTEHWRFYLLIPFPFAYVSFFWSPLELVGTGRQSMRKGF